MSRRKLTGWFPHHIKPARAGVYRTSTPNGALGFSYWTGEKWGWQQLSVAAAALSPETRGAAQDKGWLGLTAAPSTSARKAERRPGVRKLASVLAGCGIGKDLAQTAVMAKQLWNAGVRV